MKNIALDAFIDHVATFIKVDELMKEKISSACSYLLLEKKDLLLKDDQQCKHVYFLHKGILRTFHYQNGKEITYWVYSEGSVMTSWFSYLNNQSANEYIEALEATQLLLFEKSKFEILIAECPGFEKFWCKTVEQTLAFLDAFYRGFNFLSAKEKYDLLISYYPNVTQNINLGYIASLLGISQETLSRIRGKR